LAAFESNFGPGLAFEAFFQPPGCLKAAHGVLGGVLVTVSFILGKTGPAMR
jgi:hypothetical protein